MKSGFNATSAEFESLFMQAYKIHVADVRPMNSFADMSQCVSTTVTRQMSTATASVTPDTSTATLLTTPMKQKMFYFNARLLNNNVDMIFVNDFTDVTSESYKKLASVIKQLVSLMCQLYGL